MANTEAVKALDEARDAWENFREKMFDLGREIRKVDHMTHSRVEAYPGWDGTRDVGAGRNMGEWLDEIATVLGVGPGSYCTMCGEQSANLDDDGECPSCVRIVVEAAPVVAPHGPSDFLEMEYEDRFSVVGD